VTEIPWYSDLRETWKPAAVRLLLIGESPPDDGGDPTRRRFFYAEPVAQADNLFRSVVDALYGSGKLTKGDLKAPWLERLRDDGVFLIDLAARPVNALSNGARQRARRDGVGACIERAAQLAPEGIIICHTPSYNVLAAPLRAAGLPLLHDEPIPFPLGNTRARFIEKVRDAVATLPPPEGT
jgi:hypothetical protein